MESHFALVLSAHGTEDHQEHDSSHQITFHMSLEWIHQSTVPVPQQKSCSMYLFYYVCALELMNKCICVRDGML